MDKRDDLANAIAALESQRAVLGDTAVDAAIAGIKVQLSALATDPKPKTQRKQVTVLFADVSGFTAMSETMDAEDVRDIMNALWQQVDRVILDHNGRIDKHIGDAVMALWGVDKSHEDDPKQAVRAAVAMQTTLHRFAAEKNVPLQMRIGLNTGPVLLGEVGTTAEFTAMGDTVNIASRLEHAAPVGGILISHDTFRHVRGIFDMEQQPPLTVKGKTEPLQAYIVKRAKARTFRPFTRGVEGVETRMVGRDRELQALQAIWQTAVTHSHTSLITIIGRAGVGKSRLLYEFERWLEPQPASLTLLKGRASQQTQGTACFLLRDLLANQFDIRESDTLETMRQKFETGITNILGEQASIKAHFLGQWLGYDFSHSRHLDTIGSNAEQLKNRGLLYWRQFLTALARKRGLLLFLEDIHWADTPSLDAILHMLQRTPALPLLVVALARPSLLEQHPVWPTPDEHRPARDEGSKEESDSLRPAEPACHVIALNPLPQTADRELLAEILQKAVDIPDKLFQLVASRAEGNPFYMEELVKMLIDDGVIIPGAAQWHVDLTRLDESRIPGTLTGVLQARLDRLAANERATLQRASVVGRVFWDTVVKQLGDDPTQVQLTPLQKREFIYQQSETAFANTHQYLFKHDLLRDVTYQTVLKKARRLYHGQVATWLIEAAEANRRLDEYAPFIGQHYQLAGKEMEAAKWYGQAGQSAANRHAYAEAVQYLSLSLELTPNQDDKAHYNLLLTRERAYHVQGNREAQAQDLTQLVALVDRLGVLEQATVALEQAAYARATGDYAQAVIHARIAIELANEGQDSSLASQGHEVWGMALHRQEQEHAAQEQLQKALQLAQASGNQIAVATCLDQLGIITYTLGDYISAKTYHEQALQICRAMGDQQGEANCLSNLGVVARRQGDYVAAKAYYEQSLTLHLEVGSRRGEGNCLGNLGVVAEGLGDYVAAKAYYERTLVIFREIGGRWGEGLTLRNIGNMAACQGDYRAASACFEQALAVFRQIDSRWGEAICMLDLGGMAASREQDEVAEECLEHGLAIFREIGHRYEEGLILNELGALRLSQANLPLAETCYQQAAAIRQALDQPQYLLEDWAGLARLKMAQGDGNGAREYTNQIIAYLQENPRLHGSANPMRVFHFTWEVLHTLRQTEAAAHVLSLAAQMMQAYLSTNRESALQEMYLSQLHHRLLWAAWNSHD